MQHTLLSQAAPKDSPDTEPYQLDINIRKIPSTGLGAFSYSTKDCFHPQRCVKLRLRIFKRELQACLTCVPVRSEHPCLLKTLHARSNSHPSWHGWIRLYQLLDVQWGQLGFGPLACADLFDWPLMTAVRLWCMICRTGLMAKLQFNSCCCSTWVQRLLCGRVCWVGQHLTISMCDRALKEPVTPLKAAPLLRVEGIP